MVREGGSKCRLNASDPAAKCHSGLFIELLTAFASCLLRQSREPGSHCQCLPSIAISCTSSKCLHFGRILLIFITGVTQPSCNYEARCERIGSRLCSI